MSQALSIPSAGNLNQYIQYANNVPLISHQDETHYGRLLKISDDMNAAYKLIIPHLRLVISTAKEYLGYGLPLEDLIQEGNIGLMKAVKSFDPDNGARLSTYSVIWIKSQISEYVLRNWRMVKIATTKTHRKLFFNLRSMKQKLGTLCSNDISNIATTLNVTEADIRDMEQRFAAHDVSLTPPDDDTADTWISPIYNMSNDLDNPVNYLQQIQEEITTSAGLEQAMLLLSERERIVIQHRWLVPEDKQSTLNDLSLQLNISRERVRQIEAAAFHKIKQYLM